MIRIVGLALILGGLFGVWYFFLGPERDPASDGPAFHRAASFRAAFERDWSRSLGQRDLPRMSRNLAEVEITPVSKYADQILQQGLPQIPQDRLGKGRLEIHVDAWVERQQGMATVVYHFYDRRTGNKVFEVARNYTWPQGSIGR